MDIRMVTQEERLELMDLQARSFFFSYDRKKYAEEILEGEAWRNGRAAFDAQGNLVAGLDLLPFDAWFDGGTVGLGGVGGVACRAEDRGGSAVRELMSASLAEMRERGDVFSYLYPFSCPYYRKFGYEVCSSVLRIAAPAEPLKALRQPGRAERFVPGADGSDPGPIVEVYNDFASRHNLCLDREGWRWRALLERDPVTSRRHAYIWYGEDGRPGAYFLFKAAPDHDASEMHIKEAAWRDRDSLLGMLGFLSSFSSNLKTVYWELPPEVAPELLWPDALTLKAEHSFNGMARVVNVQKALRLMAKPEGQGSVVVSVKDELLPANTGVFKVEWEGGSGSVRKLRSAGPDLECSAQAFAQLVLGFKPFESLRLRQDISVNAKAEELGKLFRQKDVFLMDKF